MNEQHLFDDLRAAVLFGDTREVSLLIKLCNEKEHSHIIGMTIEYATKKSQAPCLKIILDAHPDIVCHWDALEAFKNNDVECLKLLIPFTPKENLWNILYHAVIQGKEECATLLIPVCDVSQDDSRLWVSAVLHDQINIANLLAPLVNQWEALQAMPTAGYYYSEDNILKVSQRIAQEQKQSMLEVVPVPQKSASKKIM